MTPLEWSGQDASAELLLGYQSLRDLAAAVAMTCRLDDDVTLNRRSTNRLHDCPVQSHQPVACDLSNSVFCLSAKQLLSLDLYWMYSVNTPDYHAWDCWTTHALFYSCFCFDALSLL